MKANEAPCPRCGWTIAIYYDSPDSVGPELAGHYLSHAPWTPYPKWTDCTLHDAVGKMEKFPTEEDAEAARKLLK